MGGIEIGDYVWICSGAIILPDIKICNHVVVGAGAVVTENIQEEYVLVVGAPARIVKYYSKAETFEHSV